VLHIALLDRINNFSIHNCLSLDLPKTVGEGTIHEWGQAIRTKPPHCSDHLFVGLIYNCEQTDHDFLNCFIFCGDRTQTLIAQRIRSWKQGVVVSFPLYGNKASWKLKQNCPKRMRGFDFIWYWKVRVKCVVLTIQPYRPHAHMPSCRGSLLNTGTTWHSLHPGDR